MGQDVRPNVGLDYQILYIILHQIEEELMNQLKTKTRCCFIVIVGFYLLICFVASLRGNKGFMIEAQVLLEHSEHGHQKEEEIRHMVILLLGEFKGECGEYWHLILIASHTASDFDPKVWLDRMVQLLKLKKRSSGAVICHENEELLSAGDIDDEFHDQLSRVKISHPQLIDPSVKVEEVYGIPRSLRRGSISRVTAQNVDRESRDIQNRWKIIKNNQGSRAHGMM
eukprot:10682228-Ditylum_brightwellii.AAC.2